MINLKHDLIKVKTPFRGLTLANIILEKCNLCQGTGFKIQCNIADSCLDCTQFIRCINKKDCDLCHGTGKNIVKESRKINILLSRIVTCPRVYEECPGIKNPLKCLKCIKTLPMFTFKHKGLGDLSRDAFPYIEAQGLWNLYREIFLTLYRFNDDCKDPKYWPRLFLMSPPIIQSVVILLTIWQHEELQKHDKDIS